METNLEPISKKDREIKEAVKYALENMYMLGGNPRPEPKYNEYLNKMINYVMGVVNKPQKEEPSPNH